MSSPASLRLFFAVKLSAELQERCGELLARLRNVPTRVSWVRPENLHFTLKFLGDVPTRLLPDLERLGAETGAKCPPVVVDLAGLGAFPEPSSPRVVWVGCGAGVDSLERLARVLHDTVWGSGLVLGDNKPFAAHCTIGRVKDPRQAGDLVTTLQREAGFTAGRLEAAEFQLISSELARTGPTYTTVASFPLLGSSGD
jgi:2'-5' RNA ligase